MVYRLTKTAVPWCGSMVKLLQRKFIFVAMGSLLVVLVMVLGGINLVHVYQSEQRSDGILWMLASYRGEFPEEKKARKFLENYEYREDTQSQTNEQQEETSKQPMNDSRYEAYQSMWFLRQLLNAEPHISPETKFSTRYFTVSIDTANTITDVNVSHIAAITEQNAKEYGQMVLDAEKDHGYLEQYKYLQTATETGAMIIFLDCTTQLEAVQSFLYLSCGIAALVFGVVFLLVVFFSRRAIAPIASNMEKQRQFITDAGHELKTPLAIIAANTDVLALYSGENEWTESIRNQVNRLDVLVRDLLSLARMEEQRSFAAAKLNFSALVEETAAPFAVLAAQKQVDYQLQIDPALWLTGDMSGLQQMVSVLVDNAVKYVQFGGAVHIMLKKKSRYLQLEVYNSCDIMPEGDLNQLFDRFHRTDLSRARESGGYGIGLSVAKAAALIHHGKISVERREQGICFTVKLPIQ